LRYQIKMKDTSSCSEFQIKSEIAARTGQSTMNGWRKRGRKAGNKFGTGQRPTT